MKLSRDDTVQKGPVAMTDNLLLGPDAQVNHTISLLRTVKKNEALTDGLRLTPHTLLSIDPQGKLDGKITTADGSVFKLRYTVQQKTRWIALHFGLGALDLTDRTVFGVVCKSRAPMAATFQPCLRSGRPEGFVDAHLPKHAVAYAQTSTHVDLLKLDGSKAPAQAPWRDLVLFFQTTSAEFDIQDLRVFIV